MRAYILIDLGNCGGEFWQFYTKNKVAWEEKPSDFLPPSDCPVYLFGGGTFLDIDVIRPNSL